MEYTDAPTQPQIVSFDTMQCPYCGTTLPANATKLDIDNLPDGAQEAVNSDGGTGWTPPCPPSGTHHYHFTVYALDGPTGLPDSAPTKDALAAIKGHYIGYGELVGTVAA